MSASPGLDHHPADHRPRPGIIVAAEVKKMPLQHKAQPERQFNAAAFPRISADNVNLDPDNESDRLSPSPSQFIDTLQ